MTTPKKEKQLPDDPAQSKRFEETARELEADESGKQFERAVNTVIPPKPAEAPAGPPQQKR